MFKLILLIIVGLSTNLSGIVAQDANTSCSALGFKETLLCSTCSEMENFVKDEELVNECKKCCAEEKDSSAKLYQRISLQICSWKIGHYPHIQEFADKHAPKYPNFNVAFVNGADPILIMTDDKGNTESQTCSSWKTENFIEFLDENLAKSS